MRAAPNREMSLAPLGAARQFIEKIQDPSCILVAISGGSDSTGLLLALHMALKHSGRCDIRLEAVTIDHALRIESAEEARGVAALCETLGIAHHIRRWDDEKPKSGISAAARLARYQLIGAVAAEIGADMVVVGHTLGDQLETVSMRKSRSTRQDNLGLAGMADATLYDARLWVFRPFLTVTRQDIRDLLQGCGYSWFDDPSNEDVKYERVRVRQTADAPKVVAAPDRALLSFRAAQLVEEHAKSFVGLVFLLGSDALAADASVLRHALSALAAVIGGRQFGLAAETMDRLVALVASGEAARLTAGRVVFDLRKSGVYLMRENRNIESVSVKAGETATWDGRFEVTNHSEESLDVVSGASYAVGTSRIPTTLPAGVIKRAREAQPLVRRGEKLVDAFSAEGVSIRPVLAPYDLFLTRFDLDLANALANLLERKPYPQPPV
ncbi:tRNA lysidine(34) synthetase TilS [Agrobacterium larrymoorei]|uniref:tRNA lysidine(34) synthetase TilS n=1 Tax=Agrobacterium larrymoorei TaxID=160699 RepID=UPI001573195A|nr:tRNA lysidine(34) synthetase TilS [Agrobacterium larrymoorei]NTJ43179.1 tRNA lysidine(34) synthetase TilS [Agrobacterium larrymoorei]